jgi:argininosuccinate lyase
MNLERFITDEAGDLGKKLHTGRSRNDLIATTLRLFASYTTSTIAGAVAKLADALCDLAEHNAGVMVPGTTHLQHGQPISFGHIAAAHGWAFARDLKRLDNAQKACLEYMPLGSAALAGTTVQVNLDECAKELGFASPPMNSYDAVGDRDFMIEALDAFASVAVHLGRLSEDIIYWSSTAVGLIELPRELSTGSSIMPNKRNPDVAEIVRAKSARIISLASEAKNILKSVPTSYGSDLHELKKTFVHSCSELSASLGILVPFAGGLGVNKERAQELLGKGHLLATEIADELTSQGMSFRDAYRKTAALVELADTKGLQVHELGKDDFRSILPESDLAFTGSLSFEKAVEKRGLPGGTSLDRVRSGIRCARDRIGAFASRP